MRVQRLGIFCGGLVAAITLALAATPVRTAQLGARPADDWIKVLDAPERIAGLRADEVVARLQVRPGDTVADLGAGTGPFLVPFAKAVTPKGKVYAVELEPGFFPYMRKKTEAAGVTNVQTVQGEPADPKLPAADVDLAFMHDVLHHIENRDAYLKALSKYLKPGARFAVIDYEPARSPHGGDRTLTVSKAEAADMLAAAGLRQVDDIAMFDDKWFLVFRK